MTIKEYNEKYGAHHNFYGHVKINRRNLNKNNVLLSSTNALIRDIAFDIFNEIKARNYSVDIKTIFEEVESIRDELCSIIEYFYDNGFDENKFLKSDLFQKYWKSNMPDDWQHGIKTKNSILYFRPCCIFIGRNGFSIEFND